MKLKDVEWNFIWYKSYRLFIRTAMPFIFLLLALETQDPSLTLFERIVVGILANVLFQFLFDLVNELAEVFR